MYQVRVGKNKIYLKSRYGMDWIFGGQEKLSIVSYFKPLTP
jgi:hypothetical protein